MFMYSNFGEEYFKGAKISSYKDYESTYPQLRVYFLMILDFLKKRRKLKQGRILDVGCAYGILLKFFDDIDWETYGVDISEYAISIAKKYTRARLYVHNIEEGLYMFQDKFFDIITMFDVIEHLRNPGHVLEELHRVLKTGGLLFIITPNANGMFRLIMGKKWPALKDKTHRIFFTPFTLKFTVERAGFKVLEVRTPQFYPFTNIFKKYVHSGLLRAIIRNTPLGSSIWLVAVKQELA